MKLALLPIILGVLCLSSYAKTLNLNDYAVPSDDQDDSVGFQRAIDDLKAAGGGTLIINSGDWNLNSGLNLATYGNYVSYLIQGDKGSTIKVNLNANDNGFYVGNVNQIELRDLVFVGDSTRDYDVGNLFWAANTAKQM
jgi:hypothetical protein